MRFALAIVLMLSGTVSTEAWVHGNPNTGGNFLTDNTGTSLLLDAGMLALLAQ